MFRTLLALSLLGQALGSVPAADTPAEVPPPLPEKNGVQLVIAKGSGTTREAALKSAYADAVGQVANTFVAPDLLTGGNDKVLAATILTATTGVVSEVKEVKAWEEKGVWRVEIQAKVAPLKLSEKLREAKLPVRAPVVKVDGQTEVAKLATRLKAAKDAAAWFEYVLRDYPFGCGKSEILAQPTLDLRESTEDVAVWNVRVRHSVDAAAYKRMTDWLTESLEHLSVHPSAAFSYVAIQQGGYPVAGGDREESGGKWPKDHHREHPDSYFVLLAAGATETPFAKPKPGIRYKVTGRYYFLDKAVAEPFEAAWRNTKICTRIALKDKDGKVVAQTEVDWDPYKSGETPLGILDSRYMSAYIQPSTTDTGGGGGLGNFAPQHDGVYRVRMPQNDAGRVKTAEVEVIARRQPKR